MSAGKDLTFARGGETLRGHLADPDGPAESPAIVWIPDVHGLSDLESSAELGDVAGHAFLNHTRPDAYRPEAAADPFERSVAFFDAHPSPKA